MPCRAYYTNPVISQRQYPQQQNIPPYMMDNMGPAMVRNADGTPNPLQVIDVYGTRRGPKLKPQSQKPTEAATSNLEPIIPFPPNPLVLNANPQVQVPFSPRFPYLAGVQDPRVLENLKKLVHNKQISVSVLDASQATTRAVRHAFQANENKVLDLSMACTVEPTSNNESSRDEKEDDGCFTTMFENVKVVQDMNPEDASNTVTNNGNQNKCHICGLALGEPMMYTIHMGYHGFSNRFTWNMTPEECKERLSVQLNLARQSHIQLPTLSRRF
ncbi:protein hunchback-like [Leptinotarsa decemlineata]|uniref:protein hunchback-like n=1 Tax=Leptinotarsa decemlineata TaxID=7539 RepID=UPI003D308199